MDHKKNLTGIFPPMMTIFKDDQSMDLAGLQHNIEKMNSSNIAGYMPLGSNGEFRSLSDAESLDVIRVYKKAAAPGKVIMAGAARESAYQTVEFIKAMADIGIDYASLLTPYYFASKMNEDALTKYFTYVADNSPVPVLLYCAPKFAAGIEITPALVAKLANHPNILGMKDTSGNDIKIYCDAVPAGAEFYMIAGSITKYLRGLTLGAVGGILSPANYMPEDCCKIGEYYEAGKMDEAQAVSEKLIDLNKRGPGKYSVPGVKASMDILGYVGGIPRNPLFAITAEQKEELRKLYVAEGYVKE